MSSFDFIPCFCLKKWESRFSPHKGTEIIACTSNVQNDNYIKLYNVMNFESKVQELNINDSCIAEKDRLIPEKTTKVKFRTQTQILSILPHDTHPNAFFLLTRDNVKDKVFYNAGYWAISPFENCHNHGNKYNFGSEEPFKIGIIDDENLYIACKNNCYFYNINKENPIDSISCNSIFSASQVNSIFAVGSGSTVKIYDTKDPKYQKGEIKDCHSGFVSEVVISPYNDKMIYTGGYDGVVKLFDSRNLQKPVWQKDCFDKETDSFQSQITKIAINSVFQNIIATNLFNNVKFFDTEVQNSPNLNPNNSKPKDFMDVISYFDWSPADPFLAISVNRKGEFQTHYLQYNEFDY